MQDWESLTMYKTLDSSSWQPGLASKTYDFMSSSPIVLGLMAEYFCDEFSDPRKDLLT